MLRESKNQPISIMEMKMALTREQAWQKLNEWTQTPALILHARAVEEVMKAAAHRYGAGEADEERFAITGLIHDADYDQWPEDHPNHVVAWLREQGEEEIAHAVSAHHTGWGVPHESLLDKVLLACDEITGFVGACSFVRPEGISTLTPKSVKKKLKDKSFAAGVDRHEVQAGIELLDVDLGEHIQMVIDALKPHTEELGLQGKQE